MNFVLLHNYWVTNAQGTKDKLMPSSNNYQTPEPIDIIVYQQVLLITFTKMP